MFKFGKPKPRNFTYRDELCKKPMMHLRKELEEEEEKENKKVTMRVKVKMTKQEAARLLSKCKAGGVLDFKDAAQELVKLPLDCVNVVSAVAGSEGKTVLKTIPEKLQVN